MLCHPQDCAFGIQMQQGRLKMDHSVVVVNSADTSQRGRAGLSLVGTSSAHIAVLDECLFLISTPLSAAGMSVGRGAKLIAMRCTVLPWGACRRMNSIGTVAEPTSNASSPASVGTMNLVGCWQAPRLYVCCEFRSGRFHVLHNKHTLDSTAESNSP